MPGRARQAACTTLKSTVSRSRRPGLIELDRRGEISYLARVQSWNPAAHRSPVAETKRATAAEPKPGSILHPLGPVVYRVAARRPIAARAVAAVVLAGCVALLSAAVWVTPDARGLGSHQQLGYPPCTTVALLGYPCPTCGMTTAFAHVVRGELLSAFNAHPAGLVLALTTILGCGVSLGVLITARIWVVNWYRVSPKWVALALALLVLGGWAYKVAVGVLSGTLPIRASLAG